MVVFDGHNNPFRQHIIPMAFSNPALMEAIFALSESHLQSRKKMSLLTMARDEHTRSLTPISQGSPPPQDYRGPSMLSSVAPDNALHHKNSSTRLLQDQLNDPVLSKDDEASATLLILQLYHLCDTGIGNFKTHLAGVKRLMMMREVGKETGRWAWMETVFCWLDNMCASINNCEGQLRGGYLDMIRESTDDWSIESLVGCDRDLFACLAGLARINMLSQAPVCPGSGDMDDNEDDGESEPVRNERDGRTDFWLAWNAMKAHLYEWRPTTLHAATWSRINPGELTSPRESPRSPGGSPGPSIRSPPVAHLRAQEAVEVNHWLHACNVFRYAAILYLHRLAYPHLPSSHSIFQNTVREVLDHIACIPASGGLGSKLLWPLFITGSECVVEGHRRIIRERCQDMMRESGFFNKFAGLDVLEKIWRRDDEDEARGCNDEVDMFAGSRRMGRGENRGIGGRGLRWRRVIAGEEMEYLMV